MTAGVGTDGATVEDVRPVRAGPAPARARRVAVVLLVAVVVLGAFGVFGVHSRTVRASAGGYTLAVTYPQVARAGLDVPWRARVHRAGGFADKLTIAVSADYFRMFETQGFFPDADSTTDDGTFVYFTFDTPPGEDFVFDYDAYIQPGAQLGKSATVKVIVGGTVVVQASLRTWLVP